MTDPDRPERIYGLFLRGKDVPVAERERWLAGQPLADDEREELRRLLAGAGGGGDPAAATAALDADLVAAAARGLGGAGARAAHERESIERAGDAVGPYKLVSRIGEGGFGEVWMAERREPFTQRVALKLIKPGMDSRAVIARFEQERQALAVMNHPHIAKVLDGGLTKEGRPYFAMEYVKGEPITEFCDARKLGVKARLELFAQACEAVQHAHLKGIVHRDIKPSNILAYETEGEGPKLKVIDFGVAKAMSQPLTDKTIFTETGQMIGTPAYMSPEQADPTASDIDTRSDIYSLGVLLYELVTGATPFDAKTLRAKAYGEIQRIIREDDPPTPSARLSTISTKDAELASRIEKSRGVALRELARELKTELEWIPLKAMRKEPSKRYQTAIEFANDVRAYLDGIPIAAAPESTAYRMRKYVRRHKGPVLAGALVSAALLVGLGVALVGWRETRLARDAAVAEKAAADSARAEALTAKDEALESQRRALEEKEVADAERTRAERLSSEALDAQFRAESLSEQRTYERRIDVAASDLARGQYARARHSLDSCPIWLRGWEWRWLAASSDSSLVELNAPRYYLSSAEFNADGTRIVTAGSEGTARVWDASTGASLVELRGHVSWGYSAKFNADGTRIVTASGDGTARVWDASTGASLVELKGHRSEVYSAEFSSDGTRIVTASRDGTARVWDASTGASLVELKGFRSWRRSAKFSADGTRIVTDWNDGTARVWDASTGASLVELKGHQREVYSAEFSSDGTRIVTASGDGTARVWDASTGASLVELKGHESWMRSAKFSVDGTRIVTASDDRTARVWDASTGASLVEMRGHDESLLSASFGPDGMRVLTASDDGTARVWDAHSCASRAAVLVHPAARLASAAMSPEGRRIVTGTSDGVVRVWDVDSGKDFMEFDTAREDLTTVAFSGDGRRIFVRDASGTVSEWDASTGANLGEFRSTADSSTVWSAISPDGDRMVTPSGGTIATVWDTATAATIATLEGEELGSLNVAAFSPDGSRLVTGEQLSASVWHASTGEWLVELDGHSDSVIFAGFDADGSRVITASEDRSARIYDWETAEQIAEFVGHADAVTSASLSPDGLRLVTSSRDGTVRVWEATTGASLLELRGHGGAVNSASFSADGTRIVTASDDGTVRVWDSVPYRERFAEGTDAALRDAGAEAIHDELMKRIAEPADTPTLASRSAALGERLLATCGGDRWQITSVGIAYFRVGRYREAVELLQRAGALEPEQRRCDPYGRPEGTLSAFLAMAHWQCGEKDKAREVAARFRALAAEEWFDQDVDARAWLAEVNAMIPPE